MIIADYKMDKILNEKSNLLNKLIENNIISGDSKDKTGLIKVENTSIYLIKDRQGFDEISQNVSEGNDYKGAEFYITNDIEFGCLFNSETGELTSGDIFNPIGSVNVRIEDEVMDGAEINKFQGKIYGNGFKIKNMYINEKEEQYGVALISYLGENGLIQDITSENSYVCGSFYETATFVGRNRGIVKNCVNNGNVIGNKLTGGIVGRTVGNIESCVNNGEIYGEDQQTGGIVGNCDSQESSQSFVISKCVNNGKISSNSSGTGGIVGLIYKKDFVVSECTNNGEISSKGNSVGGISGIIYEGNIEKCVNKGKITGMQSIAGGIVGTNIKAVISECQNEGNVKIITASFYGVGGITGRNEYTILNCINKGKIEGAQGTVQIGGITGNFDSKETCEISNCKNFGRIEGVSATGGIAGGVWKKNCIISRSENNGEIGIEGSTERSGGIAGTCASNMEGCINNGKVHGTNYVGGIVGTTNGNVANCINTGKVEGSISLVGGIIGYDNGGNIMECVNTGEITLKGENANYGVAGISGNVMASNEVKVERCSNKGTINLYLANSTKKTSKVSGVVANIGTEKVDEGQAYIRDCYNIGQINVYGDMYEVAIGGITSWARNTTIENCYNAGIFNVEGSKENIRGIVSTVTNVTLHNNYWLTPSLAKYGSSNTNEGAKPKEEKDLKNITSTLGNSYTNGNNNYPILKWELKKE